MFLIKSDDCKNNIAVKQLMDLIYLCILGLYVMRKVFDTTVFELSWPNSYYEYVRIAICIFTIIKIIVYDNKDIKVFLLDILYLIVFYFIYQATGYKFLLELGFFILAAKEIPYQKIIKCYTFVVALIMSITILGAMTGCIQDLVYLRDDVFKHAFGIVYTTDFGAHILFLVLACLALRKKEPDIFLNISLLFLAYILYKYSGTRNSSGCIVLLVLGGVYIKYSNKRILNDTKIIKTKRYKVLLKVIRFVDSGLILTILISALMALLFTYYYSSDNVTMSKLNQLASGRLELGKSAIEKYGFSLWGTPFKMIGVRADSFTSGEYNFVDSSYVLVCIRYGTVLFILTILGFLWLAIRVKRTKRRYMLVLLAVMALQSVIEHHLIDIAYNPFVLLIFSNIKPDSSPYIVGKQVRENIKVIKYSLAVIIGFTIYKNYSRIFSYIRTLVTLLNLNESEKNIYFILIILIGGAVNILTIGMLWNFCLAILKKNKKMVFIFGFSSIFCMIMITVGVFTCNTIILKESKYTQTVQNGKIILQQLNQVKDLKIYIDDVPYLYAENKDITNNIIPGTPYRRDIQRVVVITKASNEMTHLLNTGYMCGPISDTEYLYTNDETVLKIVRENGIKMDDYYAAKQSVDLQQMAERNKLSVDENFSLIINGSEKSMTKGPRITVYAGKYKVEYDLELIDTEISDGEVAKLRIASHKGESILKEISVNRVDFNENRRCVVFVESYIPDASNVEFLLLANGNTKLKLNSLTYEKIGKN